MRGFLTLITKGHVMVQVLFFRKIAVAVCAGFALTLTLTLASACSKDQTVSPDEPVAGDVNQPASSDPTAVPEYKIQENATGTAEAVEAPSAPVKKVKAKKNQPKAKKKSGTKKS